jgi:phage terminase large subunit-like protein
MLPTTKPKRPRAKRRSTLPVDQTTAYARDVVSGKVVAGPSVRASCQRHLQDLVDGAARGLVWDVDRAQMEIGFFTDVLVLNGGEYEGSPFKLNGWQAFIVGSLHGWRSVDGYRRFRTAYIETGKGSGKSPLAAGMGVRALTGAKPRAEIYSAATKKDQAMVLFRDAVAMVKQSPELAKRCALSGTPGKEYNIAFHAHHSFFRPLSSDQGKSGTRPHMGIVDEVHEHPDSSTIDMLKAGLKNDRDGLIFMITNSGIGQTSACWSYHDYAVKVAARSAEDDHFFSFVCDLDDNDDPFTDESCWVKANPSLPAIPGMAYLREAVIEARGMPSKASVVNRLNFCKWTEAGSPMIGAAAWKAAQLDYTEADLIGRRCYGGLDLSSTTDVTALVLAFEPLEGESQWLLLPYFWLPNDNLTERDDRDRVPYLLWRDQGFLITIEGRAIKPRIVAQQVATICAQFDVQSIGYDAWGIEPLKVAMDEDGISLPLEPFIQGFKSMGPAVSEFERRLLNGQLKHNGHPILRSHAANMVVDEDPAGNRKPAKDKATGRIDGMVAAIMAIGRSMSDKKEENIDDFIYNPIEL